MGKKKKLTYEEKLEKALKSLPFPIHDKKHRIDIYCVNDQARSNQTRFEHILQERHNLVLSDIYNISRRINESDLAKDEIRKGTYNLFIKRNKALGGYIQISLNLDYKKSNKAKIKTIFVTYKYKRKC